MSEEVPQWAQQLIKEVGEIHTSALNSEGEINALKSQIGINCAKLDTMTAKINSIEDDTKLIPQVLEIVQANGNNHEELSKRVDKLEYNKS